MKRILLSFIFTLSMLFAYTQVPEAFSYQAVVRNTSGEVISNQPVSFRISILTGSDSGTTVYSETHSVTTNDFGLANLKIGLGENKTGTFDPGGWGLDKHFVKVEIDVNGGSSFALMGTSQLLSVPYAFHAKTVEEDNVDDADADPTNEVQTLSISGSDLSISDGNTITLPLGEGGDNWGTQMVVTDATLSGTGITTRPLSVVGDLTDDQTLSISGNELSISDGNSVTLPEGSESLWTKSGSNIYYNNGFVGIGTQTPYHKLDIGGEGSEISFQNAATGAQSSVSWRDNGNDLKAVVGYYGPGASLQLANYTSGGDIFINAKDKIELQQNGSTRLAVSSYGNIGIGNTNPLTNLVIEDEFTAVGIQLFTMYSGSNSTDGLVLGFNTGGAYLHCYENLPLKFSTNDITRMSILSNGNVGIGTTSPQSRLHIKQAANNYANGLRLEQYGGSNWWGIQINSSTYNDLVFSYNGTSNRAWISHVDGTYNKSSDRRLKYNVNSIVPVLQKVMQLNPVTFLFNDEPDSDPLHFGFIAQEVQELFPEFVSENNGNLGLAYSNFGVLAIKAIQEQQKTIDSLQQQIDELRQMLQNR